ncbi:MAG: hypothetical protein Q7T71_04365, partial [Herbiconiux sp.]|nr:hypothetical protein [Herbiconiux sp.]
MESPQETRVTLTGTPEPGAVRVLTAGTGDPLLYLHGTGDAGALLPVLVTLAERYRVIRPDHPGFLDSDELGLADVPAL